MTRTALLLAVTLFAATAHAEPAPYAVGLDLVSTTLFRGIGLEASLRGGHWRGRVGYAHQRIPSLFVEMDSRDKDWHVTADVAVGAIDYWFGTSRDGAYLTAEGALDRDALRAPSGGTGTAYVPVLAPGAGYHWSPFGNAFFVEPRLFLIINGPVVAGSETVGTETFHHPAVIPAGWIVVGAQL